MKFFLAEGDVKHERIIKEKNAVIQLKVLLTIFYFMPNIIAYVRMMKLENSSPKWTICRKSLGKCSRFILFINYFSSIYNTTRKRWRKCGRESKYQVAILTARICRFNSVWKNSSMKVNGSVEGYSRSSKLYSKEMTCINRLYSTTISPINQIKM